MTDATRRPDGPPSGAVVIVPVKPLALGKSRLGDLPEAPRHELAEAFARDTVAAAMRTTHVDAVLVVTDDHRFAASMADGDAGAPRLAVIPDGVSDDLNGTLVQAAAEAERRWPGRLQVALCADLPALRPEDLDRALATASVSPGASWVRDAAGEGTTLYAAAPVEFAPVFGLASARAHEEAGAHEILGDLASLRHDVDDVGDLSRALALGVGEHTASAVAD